MTGFQDLTVAAAAAVAFAVAGAPIVAALFRVASACFAVLLLLCSDSVVSRSPVGHSNLGFLPVPRLGGRFRSWCLPCQPARFCFSDVVSRPANVENLAET